MKNKASRRAILRGRIQPRWMGLLWRRTEISRSGSRMTESRTDAYGYNDRNELTNVVKNATLNEYAYQYDDIGNRTAALDLGTNHTYTANSLNQYTQISNLCDSRLSLRSAWSLPHGSRPPSRGGYASLREEFFPQFDDDMRPRQRRRVARRSEATEPRSGRKRPRNQTLVRTATGDWTVSYNAENRPVSWTCGTTNIVMLFDRMGRRVEYVETVTDGSGESPVTTTNRHHRFVYEITAAHAGRAHWALQAERTERSDEVPREPSYLCVQRLNARSGNAIELSFAWDPTEPVATRPLVLQRQGGWNFFYTHDGNKNVSDIVSFQQARGVPAHYEYAPFGAVTAATTNTAFTAFNVAEANPFRFSSEYADDTLGLMYYNYRHYNPCAGRWTSKDPVAGFWGCNTYDFIKNQPACRVDFMGLLATSVASRHSICNNHVSSAYQSSRVRGVLRLMQNRKRLLGKDKQSECDVPRENIVCVCCSGAHFTKRDGEYNDYTHVIKICENRMIEEGYDGRSEVETTLHHEMLHALQRCRGATLNSCKDSICREINAYYNSEVFAATASEEEKRKVVFSGVQGSSKDICSSEFNKMSENTKNGTKTNQQGVPGNLDTYIEGKFDELYESCINKNKWK